VEYCTRDRLTSIKGLDRHLSLRQPRVEAAKTVKGLLA
jgi:hypothetical protein